MKQNTGRKAICLLLFSMLCAAAMSACVILALFGRGEAEDEIRVPDYVGRRAEEIDGELFSVKRSFVYSDEVTEGEVISQSPAAGEVRRRKSDGSFGPLTVTVSMGREILEIPRLEGMDKYGACALLRTMSLSVRCVPIYCTEGEDDRVLYCRPSSGERVERGERITLFVSRLREGGDGYEEFFGREERTNGQ